MGTAVALAIGVTGCTLPALGSEDYRASAARTAGDASSEIGTAAMVCLLAAQQRAWPPYLRVVVSGAEDSLSSIQDTFAALQPPSHADVPTRDDLLGLLATGGDEVTALRLALFAGRPPAPDCGPQLRKVQQQLEGAAGRLTGRPSG